MINIPIVAALTGAALLLLQTALMNTVGFRRLKYQQAIGDGGHDDLLLLVRRHGNLAENAAIFLAALTLLEMIGGLNTAVAVLGGGFVFARVMHAIGLSFGDGQNAPRFVGATGTTLTCFGTGGYLLVTAIGQIAAG